MRIYFKQMMMFTLLAGVSAPALSLNIFACEPEWTALAQEIAPDANIYSATTYKQDPHMVQARPSLIAKMRGADLVICSGAELEIGWLPALLMKANNAKVRNKERGLLYVAEHVEVLDKMEKVDRSMGDVHAKGNPHVQLSPVAISQAATVLTERLRLIDSGNAQAYTDANINFQQRWETATKTWLEKATPLHGTEMVAYHSNYRYLFHWLDIEQVADLEPKPGLAPTAGHLSTLLTQLKEHRASGIIYTAYQDPKPAAWLSDKTKIPAMEINHTVEPEQDLFALYENTISALLSLQNSQPRQ